MIPKQLIKKRDALVPEFKKWQSDEISGTRFITDRSAQGIYRNGFNACSKVILESKELKALVEALALAGHYDGTLFSNVTALKAIDQWQKFIEK